jgi:hypothetical protein
MIEVSLRIIYSGLIIGTDPDPKVLYTYFYNHARRTGRLTALKNYCYMSRAFY